MATTAEVPATDDIETKLLRMATECQQNFYEICSDWNLYKNDQHAYLKDFIGYALFGPPRTKQDFSHFFYEEKQRNTIDSVFQKVTKYGIDEGSNRVVLCGIIYNVIFRKEKATKASENADGAKKEQDNEKKNKKSKDDAERSDTKEIETEPLVYPLPVFKVRAYEKKIIIKKEDKRKKFAIEKIEKTYYIDNVGRVYKGFADYLANNTLPKCTMVLPKDGRYQGDPKFSSNACFIKQGKDTVTTKVWIEIHESPMSRTAAKVLMGGDIASTVVTVATMGVGLAAMMTPIGPAVAFASAVGAGVSGLWSVGRCAQQLADRGQHGESINVTDKNALGAWIGIAGCTMGVAATGGAVLLTRAVRTGATVGRAATIAYNAVQIGNVIVHGVGAGFKSYDIYADYTEGSGVSVMDVFLLTAHLLFFCNSVVKIQLAESMIKSTQGQVLKDYEASLRSNRHRKEFQRMTRNTKAAGTSDISSNEEIIRGICKIDNKDEFFQAMVRNRKAFSASGAKASFSSGGKVTVNGIMTIDPIEFASLPKDVRVDIVKGVSNLRELNNTPVVLKPSTGNNQVSYKNSTADSTTVLKKFCLTHSSAMMQSAPVIITDFANVLGDLRNVKNRAEIFLKLLDIGYRILQALPRDEEITVGDTLAFIVQFLWDYIKSNLREIRPGMMFEEPLTQALLNSLMSQLMPLVEEKLDMWVEAFIRWLKTQFPQSINGPFLNKHKSE